LKSTLSEISIGTPSCFGGGIGLVNLLPAFTLSQCLFVSMRWASYKQQIVGSSFYIQFAKWCLLMGKLNLLAFSFNIDKYVVIILI
jgi:hypothetical protein